MTTRKHVRELDPAGGTPGQVPTINAAGDALEYADPGAGGSPVAAADVSYAGSTNLAATNVEAALDELDAEKVAQGVDQFRTGSRDFPPYPDVKFQSYEDDPAGMVIWTQKVGADNADVNIDGSVIVKHGKGYTGTPGYADTLQVYTLAGSRGTIIGNNDYVGSGAAPYSPPTTDATTQPNGYLRFELGPVWPLSEKMRLNNRGDLIVGWDVRTTGSQYTQSGTTVTRSAGTATFTADDVGAYLLWTGPADGRCDRITGYISPTQVTVETSRTLNSATAAEVRLPKVVIRYDGTIETSAGMVVKQRPGQTGALFEIRDDTGAVVFRVDETGVTTPDLSAPATSTGELVMQDGVTGPPVPLETEARDDWLYQG